MLEQYGRYSDTRYSGEQWLGDVPKDWSVEKLKYLFSEKRHTQNLDLQCGSISFGEVVTKDDEKVPLSTKASYQEVLDGEFLVNPLNLNYDLKSLRIALSKLNVVVSAGYIVLDAAPRLNKQYYKYLMHQYDVAYMKLLGSGVRQTISFNHISNSLLPFPPPEVQTAIANFLDDKTEKIDRAIAIKERQIGLLEERKQTLIQNAVTRGLNPNALMKDSGVDWIGEIPMSWKVDKLKYVFFEKKHIKNLDLQCGSISFGEVVYKDDESVPISTKASYQEVLAGEFLLNPLNLNYDLKSLRIALSDKNVVVSAGYIVLKASANIHDSYYKYFMRQYDVLYMKLFGSGVRQTISYNHIANTFVLVPSIDEQVAVSEYLDQSIAKIAEAISSFLEQIQNLREYRASLINSAVTGKIKVPN